VAAKSLVTLRVLRLLRGWLMEYCIPEILYECLALADSISDKLGGNKIISNNMAF
jgi:hypothetical protein